MRIPDSALAAFTMASMCSMTHRATRRPNRHDERLNRSAQAARPRLFLHRPQQQRRIAPSTRTRSIRKQQPVTVTESLLEPFSICDALDIAQTVIA
jgi:hypothetical protein